MNIEFADGKAYMEIIDPLGESMGKKELDVVELYEMMNQLLQGKEKDLLFYRGVAKQWEDKYNELTKGLDYAERILKAAK